MNIKKSLPIAFVAALALFNVSAIFAATAISAEPSPPQTLTELETRLDTAFKQGATPGAAVVVIEDNQVVWQKNYGVRDLSTKAPVTDQTLFRAGSITKSFTALLAMTFVEQGQLSLDARVAELAPQLGFDNRWEATDPLRVVHLMEHTTGWQDLRFPDVALLHAEDEVSRDLVSTRRLRASRWQPGRYMAYSNVGPGVMGQILQQIGGAPYADLVQQRILSPLGMRDTYFARKDAPNAELSKSYDVDGQTEIPYHGIGMAAAGSMLSTASDLAKFVVLMNQRGLSAQGERVISEASIQRMERPQSTLAAKAGLHYGYGLGVFYAPQTNFVVYGHNGGIDGFESAYVYWPEQRKGYVLLINGGRANADALELITRYLGRNFKVASPPAEVPAGPEFAPFTGYYYPIAQRHNFMDALTRLSPNAVALSANGRINALGSERISLGANQFRKDDRAEATMIFYTTPDGQRELSTGREVMRQFTTAGLVLHGLMLILALLALVLTALALIARPLRMLVPRWRRTRSWRESLMRWTPTLAVLSFLTMIGIFLSSANAGYRAVEILGQANAATYSIYAASFVWPLLAMMGLLLSIRTKASSKLSRATAFLTSLGMLGLGVYFYSHGWVGIRFWE
jgi:CubicO group peptidase (beta-lactamase class C family)